MISLLKKTTIAAVAALAFSGAAVQQASAVTFTFSDGGGNGTGTNLGSPVGAFDFGLGLTSNNNGTGGIYTTWTSVDASNQLITGNWQYATNDVDGSYYDKLGYFIDDVYTTLVQLSVDGIPAPAFQNGTFSFSVTGGHNYGFYMVATDGVLGSGQGFVVGDVDVAAVPLPAGGLLLLGALGGIAALRRRKSV